MNFWNSLRGMVVVELTTADIPATVTACNQSGVHLFRLEILDPVTITFCLYRTQLSSLRQLAEKRGEVVTLRQKNGLYWVLRGFIPRPVLLVGVSMLLLLTLVLPSRILFIRVEGNVNLPENRILEQAELCGIRFGTSRRTVRSEQMKNALLVSLPELQWAGINTKGCTAVISVRERALSDTAKQKPGISRIVAARDGVITDLTVTRGSALCRVGQAVTEGQILVSGYTDCGRAILAQRAEAEIFGETKREISAVTPSEVLVKGEITAVRKKFSLILGKKRIFLSKDSGISGTTCDKMYQEHILSIPGGFSLPVKLVVETWSSRETVFSEPVAWEPEEFLHQYTRAYLTDQMTAGQILKEDTCVTSGNGLWCLTGDYACLELLGQEQREEIADSNEQTN